VASGDQDGVDEGHDDDQVIRDHDVHTIPVGDWLDRALMEGDRSVDRGGGRGREFH
jgi:hypothetical protein